MLSTCIHHARVACPEGIRRVNVCIEDGRIAGLASDDAIDAAINVDAQGLLLLPGFIDMHRHADLAPFQSAPSIELPQGITTQVSGNCGFSPAPNTPGTFDALRAYAAPILGDMPEALRGHDMPAFLRAASARPLAVNTGYFVGNGALRICVKGFDPSPCSPYELAHIRALLDDALAQGALGLSLGLMYAPECYYGRDELLAIASVAARHHKPVVCHMRGEGKSVVHSVEEVIDLARQTGARMHISHLKAAGKNMWGGAVDEILARIDQARAQGLQITFDAYPYAAGSTTLTTLFPPEALSGGTQALLQRLRDPAQRRAIVASLRRERDDWDNLAATTGLDRIEVADSSVEGEIGRSIAGIAAGYGRDPFDFTAELLLREGGSVTIVEHHMDPADVDKILCRPECIVISDALYSAGGRAHPRKFGAFPRFLRRYVRERPMLSLEAAVAKITRMPADFLGLHERGRIDAGCAADLVLVDWDALTDRATYEQPHQQPEGIRAVWVNGKLAFANGELLSPDAGMLI